MDTFSQAAWITGAEQSAGILLRREFHLAAPVTRAQLCICGPGVAVPAINGAIPGAALLDPPVTAYHRRLLYRVHDVGPLLAEGDNAIGVSLARSWLGLDPARTLYWKDAAWLGDPRLLLRLTVDLADGSTVDLRSGPDWRTSAGPVIEESVFAGEVYDSAREQPGWNLPGFDDSAWPRARVVGSPGGVLEEARIPPVRVVERLAPVGRTAPRPGTWVFTFPRLVAGWVALRVAEAAEVTVRYGETLHPDGTVDGTGDPGLTVGPIQTDVFRLHDDAERELRPSFTYKGFQYVQVDGLRQVPQVRAEVAHTDVDVIGSLEAGDPLLQELHHLAVRSLKNNLHGVLEDTPTFEKRGWLGDAGLIAETALDNLDMEPVFTKWLRDVADCQGDDGNVTDLAPSPYPGDCHDPAWGSAFLTVAWQTYWRSGDVSVLSEHYDNLRRYVAYLTESAVDGLVPPALYGDWIPPGYGEWGLEPDVGKFFPPEGPELCSAAYFARAVEVMSRIAAVLGERETAAAYSAQRRKIRAAFHQRFFLPGKGFYSTGRGPEFRQTSNVLPLAFGLVPDPAKYGVVTALVADLRARDGHLDTGILGTKELFRVLTEAGQVDLAYTVATQRTCPGFGWWVDQGATTLWEAWRNPRSRCHHMFGSYDHWFYSSLAGIQPTEPAYTRVLFEPSFPAALPSLSASIRTVSGTVASSWRREGNKIRMRVELPNGSRGVVALPEPGAGSPRRTCPVGPGAHEFTVQFEISCRCGCAPRPRRQPDC